VQLEPEKVLENIKQEKSKYTTTTVVTTTSTKTKTTNTVKQDNISINMKLFTSIVGFIVLVSLVIFFNFGELEVIAETEDTQEKQEIPESAYFKLQISPK